LTLYLFDADVLIDFFNDIGSAVGFIDARFESGDDLATTAVSIAEVVAGTPPELRTAVVTRLATFRCLDLDAAVGQLAGEFRYDLGRRGQTKSTTDALNAAAAQHHGAVLVTRNRRHFVVPGLNVIGPD
jgi:predicted nucleic acid-binding protein